MRYSEYEFENAQVNAHCRKIIWIRKILKSNSFHSLTSGKKLGLHKYIALNKKLLSDKRNLLIMFELKNSVSFDLI